MRGAGISSGDHDVAARKLPLWRTTRLTYVTYLHHFSDVLRVTLPWTLLLVGIMASADWLKWSWSMWFAGQFKKGIVENLGVIPYVVVGLYVLAFVLVVFAVVDIAVAWHRRLILQERSRTNGSNIARRTFWQYLALLAILTAIAAIAPLAILATAKLEQSFPTLEIIAIGLAFGLAFIACAVAMRFSLVLPACAVGNRDLSFKQSWRMTRGNTWRLLWGMLACAILPDIPLQLVLDWIGVSESKIPLEMKITGEGLTERMISDGFVRLLKLASHMFTGPLCVGFLSLSYRHFVQTARPEASPAPATAT
jgi:hypothetical protein